MHCCAAMQSSTWDFSNHYLQINENKPHFAKFICRKKKSQGVYMVSFFLKMEISEGFLCWRVSERLGSDTDRILCTLKLWMQDVLLSSRGTSTACLKRFLLLWQACSVHTYPACHRDMWAHRCKPLLPCGEDVEKDRMAGKHHCIAVIPVTPNPACLTQVNRFVHRGCPVAGLSIYHCRVKPLTMPATEVSGTSRLQQNGRGVIYWDICGPCLLYFINLTKWLNSTVLCPLRWLWKTVICFNFLIKAEYRWTFTISNVFSHTSFL